MEDTLKTPYIHCWTDTGCNILANFPELPFKIQATSDFLLEDGHGFSTLVIGNHLYVAGGHENNTSMIFDHPDHTKHFCMFDADINKWCVLPPMLKKHCYPMLVHCEGFIYSIGGAIPPLKRSNQVERYSIARGKWQMCAPLIETVQKVRALACSGRIFVLGIDTKRDGTKVEYYMVYDPESDIWIPANVIKNFPQLNCKWFGLYQNVWYCRRYEYQAEYKSVSYFIHSVTCDLESDNPTITIGPPLGDIVPDFDASKPPQYLTFDKRKLQMQSCDMHDCRWFDWLAESEIESNSDLSSLESESDESDGWLDWDQDHERSRLQIGFLNILRAKGI